MDKASFEFNKQLELDVLVNGLSEVTTDYVDKHIDRKILQEVVIPDCVTRIDQGAFKACWKLKRVTISDSVTNIGTDAFYRCTGLTNMTLGNRVTSIGDWTFYRCWDLVNLTIPRSVMRIGHHAFCDCDELKSITFEDRTLDEVKAMKYYPWGILDPEKYFKVYKLSQI